jgi:prolyl-tRNA editing enzyme YbaK/EbsC (Cys-tRNA(Pro) deacylase)
MNIRVGTLEFLVTKDHSELIAEPVAAALALIPQADTIGVAEIDPTLSDTAAFCAHYHVSITQAANCVVLEARRGDTTWLAACVIFGNTRVDVNGLARKTLEARKVSFAPMAEAVAQTRMEYGAITPVGLPNKWSILIDKAVADAAYIVIGSGMRKSKLALPGSVLASLPNVQVLPGLGRSVS